jgi:hypothetical protein
LLRRPSVEEIRAALARAEESVTRASERAMRGYLRRVNDATMQAISSPTLAASLGLVASGSDGTPSLGDLTGWWAAEVDQDLTGKIKQAWLDGYQLTSTSKVEASSLDAASSFIARVRDRLVLGLVPPVAVDSFEKIRLPIALAISEGWTRGQLADRIAAELSWSVRSAYWRREQARYDRMIDGLLDRLGPPGSPAREAARLSDPQVGRWQAQRTAAILKAEAEESYWRTRATLISQTETTGAYNAGALNAIASEGWATKEWIATGDKRTRPSHAMASGQTVPVREPFIVGGAALQMPGDPTAPAREVVRCRCAVVAGTASR